MNVLTKLMIFAADVAEPTVVEIPPEATGTPNAVLYIGAALLVIVGIGAVIFFAARSGKGGELPPAEPAADFGAPASEEASDPAGNEKE